MTLIALATTPPPSLVDLATAAHVHARALAAELEAIRAAQAVELAWCRANSRSPGDGYWHASVDAKERLRVAVALRDALEEAT